MIRRGAAYLLVLVLSVELAVWGSFLVETRPFGFAFPAAALLAAVGNTAVGIAGARVLRSRVGAVLPGLLWLGIALELGTRRGEGDLVVTGDFRGLAFLVLGAVAAAGAIGTTPGPPGSR